MLACSSKTLPAVTQGDNVPVPVSAFDRSKGDRPKCVVLAVGKSGHTIGTSQGIVKGKLARNQIELLKYSGLATESVPYTELTS